MALRLRASRCFTLSNDTFTKAMLNLATAHEQAQMTERAPQSGEGLTHAALAWSEPGAAGMGVTLPEVGPVSFWTINLETNKRKKK